MAAILPFGIPTHLTGDHRAFILDFNSRILFGNVVPPPHIAQRHGVTSNAIPLVTKFSQMVGEGCNKARINQRIQEIEQLDNLTDQDHNLLDTIDIDLTQILVGTDK